MLGGTSSAAVEASRRVGVDLEAGLVMLEVRKERGDVYGTKPNCSEAVG
jgi:hypothetical protein